MWNPLIAVIPLALVLPIEGAPDERDDGKDPACVRESCGESPVLPGLDDGVLAPEAPEALYREALAALKGLEDDDDVQALRKQIRRLAEQTKALQRELRKVQKIVGEVVGEHGGKVKEFFEEMLEGAIPEGPGRKVPPMRRFRQFQEGLPWQEHLEDGKARAKAIQEYMKKLGKDAEGHLPRIFDVIERGECGGCACCKDCDDCRSAGKKGRVWVQVESEKKGKKQRAKARARTGKRQCCKVRVKKGKKAGLKVQPKKGKKRAPKAGPRRIMLKRIEGGTPEHGVDVFRFAPEGFGKAKILIEKDGERIEKEFDLDECPDLEGMLEGLDIEGLEGLKIERNPICIVVPNPQGGAIRWDAICDELCDGEDECDGSQCGPLQILGDDPRALWYVDGGPPGRMKVVRVDGDCIVDCEGLEDCDGVCEDECVGDWECDGECEGACDGQCEDECDGQCEDDCDVRCEDQCDGEGCTVQCEVKVTGTGKNVIRIKECDGGECVPAPNCEGKTSIQKSCEPECKKTSFF